MTESELFRIALDARLMDVHTTIVGRVERYDATKQVVDVIPELKRAVSDGEGGYVLEQLPVLPNVPVCFPRAGGFFISFPIQKGDKVAVMFAERSIAAWKQKGESVDPGDRRMHPLAGAIALPGVYPNGSELDDASDADMMLGKDGTSGAQIKITSSEVHLGGGSQYVALANLVKSRLDQIQGIFDAHKHSTGTGDTNAPTVLIGSLAAVAASKVKAT